MNLDTELEAWRSEWQSEAAVPANLRQRVERQSRWMRLMIAGDVMVTVVIGGGTIGLAWRAPQADMVLLAAATWLFIAAAWAFRLMLNRGLWSPGEVDTAAFVELLIRRCRAKLAGTVFGGVLYICEIVFCLGWIYAHSAAHTPLLAWLFFSSVFIDLVWVFSAAFFGFLVWYQRKNRGELEWLMKLRDDGQGARQV
jgi:hypothetical protein